ncbi:MAG: hypothetical protein JW917_04915 [Ignavibacteria bacterium]|nr:hypothetical protein [Ignavibacteria bacterium]
MLFVNHYYRLRYSISSNHNFYILNFFLLGVCFALYLVNNYLIKPYCSSFFTDNHFNDVLAGILLLSISNVLLSFYSKKDFVMKKFYLMMIFLLAAGLFWEYVTPLYNADAVSDVKDIPAYLTGGVVYYIIVKTEKLLRDE